MAKSKDEIALDARRIDQTHRTIRAAIIGVCIMIPVCMLIVCGTLIALKEMEDPGWVKILLVVLAPNGVVGGLIWVVIRWIRSRLNAIEKKVQSGMGPAVATDPNKST
jgi:hypothetical protein